MKIKVRNTIIDSEKEPFTLIFDNDEQKQEVINHLSKMELKEGERKYTQFPSDMSDEEIDQFIDQKSISNDLEYKDKYIRVLSDFENYKKRALKEKEDIKNSTTSKIFETLLDIDSDLALAMKNIKDEETLKGINLILNKLTKYLKSHGIEPISVDKYDEDLHDVISVVDGGDKVTEVSKGYTLHGKTIRHPKIILGK